MKLNKNHLLLTITVIFTAFFIGLFIGRATAKHQMLFYNGSTQNTTEQESNVSEGTQTIVDGKLNINVATAEELTLLPGIGEVLAHRIIDYRTEHGPFTDVGDLVNVNGIGQIKLQEIENYITTGG